MKKNKSIINKLIVSIVLILSIILLTTKSIAVPTEFSVYQQDGDTPNVENHHYKPSKDGDGMWSFCISHDQDYKANWDGKPKEKDGGCARKGGKYCPDKVSKPANLFYMKYKLVEVLDPKAYQGVLYMMYNEMENGNNVADWQNRLWSTNLNNGTKTSINDDLSNEANEFEDFYNSFHNKKGKDKFKYNISSNTEMSDINRVVKPKSTTYSIGPFNIEYPDGTNNGTNEFCWIESIEAEITGSDGSSINAKGFSLSDGDGNPLNDLGKGGSQSLNDTDITASFKIPSDMQSFNGNIIITFKYLESFEAEMYKYDGHFVNMKWVKQENGTHEVEVPGDANTNGGVITENGIFMGYKPYKITCQKYKYVLEEGEEGDKTQSILKMGKIKPVYKTEPILVPIGVQPTPPPPPTPTPTVTPTPTEEEEDEPEEPAPLPIEFKMEIAGYVFLDEKEGKTVEGNNQMDDGEGFANVYVHVYGKDESGDIKYSQGFMTDSNGRYATGKVLDPKLKYYVEFFYNGMLYETINHGDSIEYNSEQWAKSSKAAEVDRAGFNSRFQEIGSYPSNYQSQFGGYNKVFLQEDIISTFKQLSEELNRTNGDIGAAVANLGNTEQAKFAGDCMIRAKTDESLTVTFPWFEETSNAGIYPVYGDKGYTLEETTEPLELSGDTYYPIYEGQRQINCGLKLRSTLDLALYKDIVNAVVSINDKSETYIYNKLDDSAFPIGVSEAEYLAGMRGAYKEGANVNGIRELATRDVETNAYNEYTRNEEANNAQLFDSTGGTPYDLPEDKKLDIELTYKVEVVNQSSTSAIVKEYVDYYDNNLEFVGAFIGQEITDPQTGRTIIQKVGEVRSSNQTKYQQSSEFKSNGYKTIYLIPEERVLDSNQKQDIYVTLKLVGQNKAGEILSAVINSGGELEVLNLVEINGYKTQEGLIDIDSIPGNLNISGIAGLTTETITNYPGIRDMYEDDTRRAPSLIFKEHESKAISGTVFEDNTGWNDSKIHTGDTRKANGILDKDDTRIAGVQVDLVEIKNGQLITRASRLTDENGNYSFSGLLPGDYVIRYIYGANNQTAMSQDSWIKGANKKSYNGQDFQSTIFQDKNSYYWYTEGNNLSDAKDDDARVKEVIGYSKNEYGVEITNHKAEVFKSYEEKQASHISKEYNEKLVEELKNKTYRYAYTPIIPIEVEYAKVSITGNQSAESYEHNITGIDFGIVERPRSELILDQDIARIKVIASDGVTVLFDADGSQSVNSLQWIKGRAGLARDKYNGADISGANKVAYTVGELANVILDEELMNGAKIEVTWKLTVTNNGERDNNATTEAKTIIDYVGNNLDFDEKLNPEWKVVKIGDIQNSGKGTYVNSASGIDLSAQSTVIQAAQNNPLTKPIGPGEQTSATLTLSKIMSTESAIDSLSYSNIAEIVEQANTVGRYDRGATPGNQDPYKIPKEHDTAGAEGNGIVDGTVIVTPPTGSHYIYYIIGITSALILTVGIILIKKFAIDKK